MIKAGIRLISLTLLAFSCLSWGFYGHKKINRYAVFSLPPEMIGFYKRHIEYLTQHAVDPDKRRYVSENEAVKHYIDIDHFEKVGEDPFEVVPKRWKAAVEKFGEDSLKSFGILPWNIVWTHRRLKEAFLAKDIPSILQMSAELGHYVGDAHVPLHTTENYNGQLTGQRGIHGLWESRIPELEGEDYDLLSNKAEYLSNLLEMSWQIVYESHQLLDSVLYLERSCTEEIGEDRKYSLSQRGNSLSRQYSSDFALYYSKKMNKMVEERMRLAIHRLASFWFTAWVEAGQPDLDDLVLGKEQDLENDSLENAYQQAIEIKGREHED
ncbi:MAG: S1/P1 Nuclease [Flavobacteriales bacterium]|nr:S1/P1 Nuclease [Flavobacteriales bacterium]|tara:strand:+ start:653 stop:1624 length:972 start_codon:yes stop_codon:yes gene_type:complete